MGDGGKVISVKAGTMPIAELQWAPLEDLPEPQRKLALDAFMYLGGYELVDRTVVHAYKHHSTTQPLR